MSEYQRYEFMTCDRPLTKAEIDQVDKLSSHMHVSATHAVVDYNWGDFKHDPIRVLQDYFDGFLYWANWGNPQLAFRFPPGILPADLIEGYDLEDFVTFTRRPKFDILDIHFDEIESPDEWIDYELSSLIGIRDELLNGDMRSIYIVWLAAQNMLGSYDEEEEYEISVPPVPPGMDSLTGPQRALAELFQVPEDILAATVRYSEASMPKKATDDIAALVDLLPAERSKDYLIRLAHNEPGLSYTLVRELHALKQGMDSPPPPTGERVTYATLLFDSRAIQVQREREEREQQEAARQLHLQDIYEHQDTYWQQVDQAVARASGTGYDQAVRLLVELRDAADQFKTSQTFQGRFSIWVQPHLRRSTLMKRLKGHAFTIPKP